MTKETFLKFMMDHNVSRAITNGLRSKGVDVLTAEEDGADRLLDPELLDRATELKRVLFSQDKDLIREGFKRQEQGTYFYGVVYAHQVRVTVGTCVENLEMISKIGTIEDIENTVQFLPL